MSVMLYAMRLATDREANVLRQLVAGDKYGIQIVDGSGGSISRNTVYVLLGRMEARKMVVGRKVAATAGESGPPRRVYSITRIGRAELSAHDAAESAMRKARR